MAYVIALAGKGVTEKTTVAALTIRYITEKKKRPVLAVDADPNNCLNEALGVDIHATIATLNNRWA
jgi:CO dehydrogenase maturation factor